MTFCHLLMPRNKGRMSAIKEEGTKEGMGEKGGKEGRLNKQTKIPKSIRAEATKQIKVVMATGVCGQQHASPNARN